MIKSWFTYQYNLLFGNWRLAGSEWPGKFKKQNKNIYYLILLI